MTGRQGVGAAAAASDGLGGRVDHHRLNNGLRVAVSPDPRAPVVGVGVLYDVGFRSEPPGRSGFAHLFEHLMFQGSERVDRDLQASITEGSGGSFRAATHPDHTEFLQVLPTEALERGLFMEGDRMRAPLINAAALRAQAQVVKEEILLNVHNRPYGGFPWTVLPSLLYARFGNAHNGYGEFGSLERATVEQCHDFFETAYTPSNALLVVTGDTDIEEVSRLAERHFGAVRPRPAPERESFQEPEPETERWGEHWDRHAPWPAVAVGWQLPDPCSCREAYLDHLVLRAVLADHQHARLTGRLVHREAVAFDVRVRCGLLGGAFESREPDTFTVTVTHKAGVSANDIVAMIDEELTNLAAAGPEDAELQTAIGRLTMAMCREQDRLGSRTRDIGVHELLFGDGAAAGRLAADVALVTPQRVAASARRLAPHRRAVVELRPGQPPVGAGP